MTVFLVKTPGEHLLWSLENLESNDLEKFKFMLHNTSPEKEQPRIPWNQLQMAAPVRVADLLLRHYGELGALQLTLQVLRAINQNQLVAELCSAIDPEKLLRENGGSSGESVSRTLRMPLLPEEAKQPATGDRTCNQSETLRRSSQREPPSSHRDQKGLEDPGAPEAQSEPATKKLNLFPIRALVPNKAQDKSLQIRRNVSFPGRLQDVFRSGIMKREPRDSSEKERPKSLEVTVSPSNREPPNHEPFLTLKTPCSAGRPTEAACALRSAQDGGPACGACMPRSCSCPSAPCGDPTTSGPQGGRARFSEKGSAHCERQKGQAAASLSPRALPQCRRHLRQVLLLFCETDQTPLCLLCRLSEAHREHRVRPLEEAAEECREQIQKQLQHLKELRLSREEQRSQGQKKTEDLLKQILLQKRKVQWQLRELCRVLELQEQLLVAWLEDLEETISQAGETYSSRASGDIASLDKLIWDLEAGQRQPMWTLMQKGDIRVTLHRAETQMGSEPWTTSEDTKHKIHLLCRKSAVLENNIKWFSETLRSEMEPFSVPDLTGAKAYAVQVTLDADTAHPNLTFSKDLKSVKLGKKDKRLPDSPERFESCMVTLGFPRFFSGRHYWEVEVGNKTGWILGICKASVDKKGSMTLSPEKGYWVLIKTRQSAYQVSTFPPTHLHIREPPRCVGIFLDYKSGGISFYNVTAKSHIYTFTGFSSSEPLQPLFSPGKSAPSPGSSAGITRCHQGQRPRERTNGGRCRRGVSEAGIGRPGRRQTAGGARGPHSGEASSRAPRATRSRRRLLAA